MIRPFESTSSGSFTVPEWFARYWHPDSEAMRYWTWQADLARQGQPHKLPDDTMRRPGNELHQLTAKDFWQKVPKDFETILDVGCSDGYMVKIFQESGKRATGVNDFLYPTDLVWIEEHRLDVREMDMHALTFPAGSFDAVWCRHTLEHSFAPLQVLMEISRVLCRGGYLFLVLPPPPNPTSLFAATHAV